jgi:hypothetical protein
LIVHDSCPSHRFGDLVAKDHLAYWKLKVLDQEQKLESFKCEGIISHEEDVEDLREELESVAQRLKAKSRSQVISPSSDAERSSNRKQKVEAMKKELIKSVIISTLIGLVAVVCPAVSFLMTREEGVAQILEDAS